MAEFSFGFTEGSFLQLKCHQKHFVISKKEPNEFIKNGEGTGIVKLSNNISQQVTALSDSYSACENRYHMMKTSSV